MTYCQFFSILLYAIKIASGLQISHRNDYNRIFRAHTRIYITKTEILSPTSSSSASFVSQPTDTDAWKKMFTSCRNESAEVINAPDLPSDLVGTFYRNGGGKYDIGKDKVIHPFDSDGMITAITMSNGSLIFRNKFVRTTGYLKELKANKICYRNAFGTQRSGGMLSNIFDVKMKNLANTNVIYRDKRLYALWEGGLPYCLEADTLRTMGASTLKGVLQPKSTFSAHPRVDAKSGRLINFSANQSPKSCNIVVYEFDDEMKVQKQTSFDVPGFVFFHDFIVTEKYYLFVQAPTAFDPLPFLAGLKGPAQCISFEKDKPSILYAVSREDPSDVQQVPLDAHFNFHFANAFDDENGKIAFDVVWSPEMQLGEMKDTNQPIWVDLDYATTVPYNLLMRYTVDPVSKAFDRKQLSKFNVDFPSVNPKNSCRKHRFIFSSAGSDVSKSSPLRGLLRIDTEHVGQESFWFGQPYEYLSEPVFARRSASGSGDNNEDDGYIVSILFNGKDLTSQFVVFDATDIAAGPVSRVDLPRALSFGLHGTFVPDLVFDAEELLRRWKAVDALESKSWNKMEGGFSGLGISAML